MYSLLLLGTYVPLTMEGNILVDNVLASCYASTYHDIAHIVLAPMQWFPQMTQWIFGDDYGFQAYVDILGNVGRLILPYDIA